MKKLLFLLSILFTLLFFSCKSYQIFETATGSNDIKNKEGLYVFENDTIKIEYNFWFEKGIMQFSVTNKINKPIYIDWSKSALVLNGINLSYFENKETKESSYKSMGVNMSNALGYNTKLINSRTVGWEITLKEQKITSLAPSSSIVKAFYSLRSKVQNKSIGKEYKFNSKNSPVNFTNFIAYSTKENFVEEY